MLEQQIEKLTSRVAALESEAKTTNNLLTDILVAIREGGLPPAPSVAVAVDNTQDDKAEDKPVEAKAKTPKAKKPKAATVEDVREALMNYRDAHGKDATVELMTDFLPKGAKPKTSTPILSRLVQSKKRPRREDVGRHSGVRRYLPSISDWSGSSRWHGQADQANGVFVRLLLRFLDQGQGGYKVPSSPVSGVLFCIKPER